jgi:hypothetical protein
VRRYKENERVQFSFTLEAPNTRVSLGETSL